MCGSAVRQERLGGFHVNRALQHLETDPSREPGDRAGNPREETNGGREARERDKDLEDGALNEPDYCGN